MSRYPARSASLVITLFCALVNFVIALQVLSTWRSLKWETESEWEASGDRWKVDGIKIIWLTCSIYFAAAAVVSSLGFVGVVKNKSSLVRFYRDYSIGDFVFTTLSTVCAAYGAFQSSTRAGVCEELSRQPEIMRDLAEMGLNMENCERWFERAVMAFVAISIIVTVARLHFLLAVSNYYAHLSRYTSPRSPGHHNRSRPFSLQKIYLLPQTDNNRNMVYAPVPLSELPHDLRRAAKEAWVKTSQIESPTRASGEICLPSLPDEPLLPAYYDKQSDALL